MSVFTLLMLISFSLYLYLSVIEMISLYRLPNVVFTIRCISKQQPLANQYIQNQTIEINGMDHASIGVNHIRKSISVHFPDSNKHFGKHAFWIVLWYCG